MVVLALPSTSDARYHARRRRNLIAALGGCCARCGRGPNAPQFPLEFDHPHGDGRDDRLTHGGTTGVIANALRLIANGQSPDLQLLCPPCHTEKSYECGDYEWRTL